MLKGIDISHLNSQINIPHLPAQGISFVFMKATQGLTMQDQAFQGYWHAIRAIPGNEKGELVKLGDYHFFNPMVDGVAQAKNYLSRGVNYSLPGVLPPVVDVEDLVGSDAADTAKLNAWVPKNWMTSLGRLNDFLAYVKEQTGKDCIIYTYNNYFREYFHGHAFPNNRMWLASLQTAKQTNCPVRYDTGKLPDFWQYTWRLNNTDLDGDYFMGTQSELDELCNIKPQIA